LDTSREHAAGLLKSWHESGPQPKPQPGKARFKRSYANGLSGTYRISSARDADQLTEVLQSLPIWPLITLEVTPLATHPLFAEMARQGQD
jgi:muconolactone delta-isomerase